MQDIKSNQTTSIFNGLFAMDSQNQAGVKSDISYKINGIFQEPSGFFEFIGKDQQPPLDCVNYFLAEISLILDSH